MNTEAINHEPAITYMQTGNQVTGRPCLGAWASYGLGSLNENLPTFVVLVAKPTNTEQVQAISARLWSSGFLPGEHAGRVVPHGGRSDSLHQQSARRARAKFAARRSMASTRSTRSTFEQLRRSGNANAHSAIRNGVPHAIERAGADRPRERTGVDATSSTATRRRSRARSPTRRCSRGAWSSAACGSCRSTTTTGTRTPTSPAACRPVPRRRPALLRPDSRPEAARPARRNADHLGRRIRPHDLLARRAVEAELRSRSSPALLHDVDGRRRRQRRRRSTARPTISPTTS